MNNSALNAIQTARRDALVDYYITYCAPQTLLADKTPLNARIKTADELYEYLLLDTQIGPEVITSRVAEAVSSLQLYINRCLEGNDPDVDNAVSAVITQESKPGGFLYDWPKYNQVFSTWAGKERLQYYPSTYVDPSLRYNKTELFKALEETINQGRISDERVNTGFQQYLLDFEVLSHLDTIGGYQAGLSASTNCQDTLYFIGRSQNAPYAYYWRSCNMSVRDDNGGLTAGAWSQWLKVNVPATETYQNQLMPCWFNNRLYVCWVSKEQVGVMPGVTSPPDFTYFSNIWYMSDDGSWVSYQKEDIG
ncbi:neuraminidase-like domain-containing protein, partial [Pseudomonas sp. NPDC087346]|uniref:neuraminidase-like domain-containing protein n=1 Tax=Pseudomonas sp. NPDC087346 TaxID=3364438 RepID=UPI00382FA6AA